jgi:predicted membrane protein
MNTNNKTKTILLAIVSIALMVGGGVMINCAINVLYLSSSALTVLSLILAAIFVYVLGATILGRRFAIENSRHSFNGFNNSITFAFLVIAAGCLLLCFNTGLLNPLWKDYFFSWYMLLLVVGAICICRYHFITGLILAAVGKFFLMDKASALFRDDFNYEAFITTYWPLLIIIFGVIILLMVFIRPNRLRTYNHSCWNSNKSTAGNENSDGKINYKYVFSGTEQVILDPVFRGGDIEAIFGGLELDLRRTTLPEGETFLYINALFGGVEITAPESWDIEVRSNALFGGVYDERSKNADKDRTRKLIIVTKCKFGGVEIK